MNKEILGLRTCAYPVTDPGAVSHEAPTNYGGELMIAAVKDPWDKILGIIYNPDFRLSE